MVRRLIKPLEQPTKGRTEVHYCTITDADPHRWREIDLNSQPKVLLQQFRKTKAPLTTVNVLNIDKPAASSYTTESSHINVIIYDVDGDDYNCELLPLLLNPQDIVLVVYSAVEVLTSHSFQSLDFFLQLVCSHCSAESCRSNLNSHHWPRIVMVGTHEDFLTPKSKAVINDLFHNYYSGRLFSKHLEKFHYVDCIKGRKDRLQDTILSASKPLRSKHYPLAYFKFECSILDLRHTRIGIKKNEAFKIANQYGITSRESLLNYCTQKGIILYYPTIESLRDDLFISPQIIINLLSIVLAKNNPRMMVIGMSLRDRFAQLDESSKELVVNLLLNFHFAGCLSGTHYSKTIGFHFRNDTILMPLHLKWINATVKFDHTEITYFFPDEFLPKCVFHQLLASTVDWCCIENHRILK